MHDYQRYATEYPHAPQHAWFVHYEDADGSERITYTDGWNDAAPNDSLGAGVDLPLVFRSRKRVGQDPPIPARQTERYRALKDVCKHAGDYETFPEPLDGPESGLMFTARWPTDTPSLLLKVVPGYETWATDGLWVLVDELEDETVLENVACELTISTTVIAHVADYPDREGVTDALEYPGL